MRLSRSKHAVSSILAVLVVILLLSTFTASLILISERQGNTVPGLLETSEEISQGVRENLEAKLDAVTGETVHIYVKNTGTAAAQIMEVLATKLDGSLQTIKVDPPETLIPLEERVFPATIPGGYNRLGLLTERGKVYVVDTGSSSQQQPFDFTVSVDPTSSSVQQGGSVQTTVTITLQSGSSQTVTLSASGLPSGASAIFNPSSGNPTFTSTLTISAGTSTPTGTYTLAVTGTGGELTRTATYALTVTSASQPFDFSVSVSPNSGSVQQGNSITSSITVSLSSGSPQTVSLSASGMPSASSASFNPLLRKPHFYEHNDSYNVIRNPYWNIHGHGDSFWRRLNEDINVRFNSYFLISAAPHLIHGYVHTNRASNRNNMECNVRRNHKVFNRFVHNVHGWFRRLQLDCFNAGFWRFRRQVRRLASLRLHECALPDRPVYYLRN